MFGVEPWKADRGVAHVGECRMKRAIVFIVMFLLLGGLAGGLGYFQFVVKPEMIKGFISKAPPPVSSVAVTEARTESWEPRLPAIGTFRAVAGIDIAPQIGGTVRSINFQSGQDVEKGALLVQIDDVIEQADLAANVATLKNADLALERQRQLVTGGSTTRANLDAAQATRDSAAAAVDKTRAQISQKALTAPFSGRVGLRKIDQGQYVGVGTSIVTLQQLDPIYVDFPIPEQNIGALAIDQQVEVSVDAYPDKPFAGKVRSIDARVSSDTRNVMVRAEVANADKRLRPGMFANVAVLAGKPKEFVTLPRTAISYSLYGDAVFVLAPAPSQPSPGAAQAAPAPVQSGQIFTAQRRFVRTGESRGDRVAILEGVKNGERVISEGQIKLLPNSLVRIDPNAGLKPAATLPKE